MKPKEAQRIAQHHLGDRLQRLFCFADAWRIDMVDPAGAFVSEMFATEADFVEGCRRWADKFQAAGWVPTHARLEWIREYDDFTLCLTAGKVWTDLCFIGRPSCMGPKYRDVQSAPGVVPKLECDYMHLPEAVAYISAWAAENLPYHLPQFPFGASDV